MQESIRLISACLSSIANIVLPKDFFYFLSKPWEVKVLTNPYDYLSDSYISPKFCFVDVADKPRLSLRPDVSLAVILIKVVVL